MKAQSRIEMLVTRLHGLTGVFRKCFKAGTIMALAASPSAILLSLPAQANDPTAEVVNINIGVRDDAKPFSYIDIPAKSENILPGFSGFSIEVCRHVLKKMQALPRYSKFRFNAANISARDRFRKLGVEGELFMLCGPDSITSERLSEYRASHAFFLSGMTYAYLNPRSPNFPRNHYCGNVIGVVRGTTADTEGLADIASRDLLMRFDHALDLELSKSSKRIEMTWKKLREITDKVLEDARAQLYVWDQADHPDDLNTDVSRHAKLRLETEILEDKIGDIDLSKLDTVLDSLVSQGIGLAGKITDLMQKQHQLINKQIAQEITTDECPQGFTSLPIRKYKGHDEGIKNFCEGKVLYYLADFDILKEKTREIADCDIVMNRFTRSREVYGVYFPRQDSFDSDPDSNSDVLVDVSSFYADFNHFLFLAMQGEQSEVEKIFDDEFAVQQKSEELERFFDGFKIKTP